VKPVLDAIEAFVAGLGVPVLETWGWAAYGAGLVLALAAYGGFTFRVDGRWGLGRERLAWDTKALLSIPVTFLLVVATGYLGSFVVLVPGAQTLESLKDLVVFLCIVLFGYPALVTVPFAYGLSDLVEGVPPGFLLDWLPGYFINPACFWLAYQILGHEPDFRRARTWPRYLGFVALFIALEPMLWGRICAGKFGAAVSYANVSSALFFTTGITWILAPAAMLFALPLARRYGMFWAEIPLHLQVRRLGTRDWRWHCAGDGSGEAFAVVKGWPIRMTLMTPFMGLVFLAVAATAYATLRSARADATHLARRLHEQIAENLQLRLGPELAAAPGERARALIEAQLRRAPIADGGVAFVIDRSGAVVGASLPPTGPIARAVLDAFQQVTRQRAPGAAVDLELDTVTEKPLVRTSWLARATPFQGAGDGSTGWTLLTAMPESYYLAGWRTGSSRSAMIVALALALTLALGSGLATQVTRCLRDLSAATRALGRGQLEVRVPRGGLGELRLVTESFNEMAERLDESVAEQGRMRQILAAETRVLEMIATGKSLAAVLEEVARNVESLSPGTLASVVLLDTEGRHIASVVAPSLPPAFSRAILQAPIGPRAGSCGTAAYRREPVVVTDIERDPLWDDYRTLARAHGLRACWSTPILGSGRSVLGTFAMYYREVRSPTPEDFHVIERATHLAGVAIERRDLEEQFRQAQKMEAVGHLAAGVAHDFNNLLTVIISYADCMAADGADPDDREAILAIRGAGERAAGLTRQLLSFSRKTILQPQVLDLNAEIRNTEKILRRVIGEDVRFETALASDVLRVNVDPGQLAQVLMNLAVNARDAMPGGGALTITTRNAFLDEDHCRLHPEARPGPHVVLAVADTGVGMTPEVRARIFEPFFTTKGVGKGTGLGLATVHGIVRQSGGHIVVSSEVGRGTTFQLCLPAVEGVAVERPAPAPAERRPRAKETILLVEDDPAVRNVSLKILEAQGYDVLVGTDGRDAVAVAEKHAGLIDLVITDVVMPGLNGREVAELLRVHRPNIRVLFASGYTDDAMVLRGVLHHEVAFLAKPFTPGDLARKVREVLDAAPVPPAAASPIAV
jgi:signal transduction histidine kinase/CheY-like chemotaxis protein